MQYQHIKLGMLVVYTRVSPLLKTHYSDFHFFQVKKYLPSARVLKSSGPDAPGAGWMKTREQTSIVSFILTYDTYI